jgi:hypothetical protein
MRVAQRDLKDFSLKSAGEPSLKLLHFLTRNSIGHSSTKMPILISLGPHLVISRSFLGFLKPFKVFGLAQVLQFNIQSLSPHSLATEFDCPQF